MDDLDPLRREFEDRRELEDCDIGVGPLISAEVEKAVRKAVPRGTPDRDVKVADLFQETFLGPLIQEGQLVYILETAHDLDEFHRLLHKHVRRAAGRQRPRTVVDNLLRRCRRLLKEASYVRVESGTQVAFRLADKVVEKRRPTPDELRDAAVRASTVEKIRPRRRPPGALEERAPRVYSTDNLRILLGAVADELPTIFTSSDLREILELTLTDWILVLLEEDDASSRPADELDPGETAVVNEIADRVISRLQNEPAELTLVLRLFLAGEHDAVIAAKIGKKRTTAINRRKALERIMREEFGDQPAKLGPAVLSKLGLWLAQTRIEADDQ